MASEKNLVTKARLEQIKTAEYELVDNLYQHANASLSKAHGFILYKLPHPTLDAYGNDISFYADSNGDRVGYFYLRLSYNETNYWVPLESSTLAGKDPTTGISRTTGLETETVVAPGGTAWVTDFTPEDEQDLIVTNDSVLLPHTKLAHWETHDGGIYQVLPQITYDSNSHIVGNYVAVLAVDGKELRLPCDTRLGGPIQPPRNVSAVPAAISWHFGEGEGYGGGTICTASWQGTAPFTIIWQLLGAGSVWLNLTNPDGSSAGAKTSYDNRLRISGYANHTSFGSVFTFTGVGTEEGGNNGTMRVLVTNSQGSGVATVSLYAKDETSCAVFSAGVEIGMMPFSDFRTALHYRLSKDWLFANNYVWGGYLVAGKRVKPHIIARNWFGRFMCRHVLPHVAHGMRWRMGKAPFRWWSTTVAYSYGSILFVLYWLNKKEADAEIESMGKFSLMKMYHRRLKRLRKNRTKE